MRRSLLALVLAVVLAPPLHAKGSAFRAGDRVAVKSDHAAIKQGQKVVGWLAKGQWVRIRLIQGSFALIHYTAADGTKKEGYVALSDLERPVRKPKVTPPAPYSPGDEVVVVAKVAKLKKGKTVLGLIPAGTRLRVKKVQGKWIGAWADVDGKRTWGWIDHTQVDFAPISTKGKEPPKRKEPKR